MAIPSIIESFGFFFCKVLLCVRPFYSQMSYSLLISLQEFFVIKSITNICFHKKVARKLNQYLVGWYNNDKIPLLQGNLYTKYCIKFLFSISLRLFNHLIYPMRLIVLSMLILHLRILRQSVQLLIKYKSPKCVHS